MQTLLETQERVGKRLKRLRRERSWSQHMLAERSGVRQPTISWIELGKGTPKPATIRKLAEALEVHPLILAPYELLGDI